MRDFRTGATALLAASLGLLALAVVPAPARAEWVGPYYDRTDYVSFNSYVDSSSGVYRMAGSASGTADLEPIDPSSPYSSSSAPCTVKRTVQAYYYWHNDGSNPTVGRNYLTTHLSWAEEIVDEPDCFVSGAAICSNTILAGTTTLTTTTEYNNADTLAPVYVQQGGIPSDVYTAMNPSTSNASTYWVEFDGGTLTASDDCIYPSPDASGNCYCQCSFTAAIANPNSPDAVYYEVSTDPASGASVPSGGSFSYGGGVHIQAVNGGGAAAGTTFSVTGATSLFTQASGTSADITLTRNATSGSGSVTVTATYTDANGAVVTTPAYVLNAI